ncbi:hypothetical protein ABW20_dc0101919 [Dactylellina cionopaga]|nr:hypothetical protein ABW20_dc0101919 [Dactylellina cionopaga]
MRFSLLVLVAAAATSTSASPIPPRAKELIGAAINGAGLVCAFQGNQCQQIGDSVREGVKTVITNPRPVDEPTFGN